MKIDPPPSPGRAARRLSRRPRRAFTLVEIVIVIALIGGLMAVLVGNFGDLLTGGQADTEGIKIKSKIGGALMLYRAHVGSFPSEQEGGLNALLAAPESAGASWKGPYMKDTDLLDTWKMPYNYKAPGTHNPKGYDLWSNGPNRTNENGDGDDVSNWK